MVRRRSIIAVCAAVVASCSPVLAASQTDLTERQQELKAERRKAREEARQLLASAGEGPARNKDLELDVVKTDEFAETVLTMKPPVVTMGIGQIDHEKITRILARTNDLINNAYELIQNERTLKEGQDMMTRATSMFAEVKELIKSRVVTSVVSGGGEGGGGDDRNLLRKKYASHDLDKVSEDEQRSLDIARKIYETMVTFPECVGTLLQECLEVINEEIGNLGLSTIETVVHEKRNQDQDGYNKVVIITNELCDLVKGRIGDGIVSYPYLWNDKVGGLRTLGIDGKWNCHDYTPEDCCAMIKQSVPNPDTNDNHLECHIFVPFGGVGNPRRNDRVFITLSPDGRVHEPPIIQ